MENVVVTALDDVDGVDLDIAKMIHRCGHGLWPVAERLARVEPLGMQPDSPGLKLGQGVGFSHAGHRAAM
jgi:hypothetical protein